MTLTNVLLIIIAAMLSGLGTLAVYMLKDTRDWNAKISSKMDRLHDKFFAHIGDSTVHCTPEKAQHYKG